MKENKKSVGFITTILTLLVTAAGLVAYLINTGTIYFSNLGKSPVIIGCLAAAVAALIGWMALAPAGRAGWADGLAPLAPVLTMIALMQLLNSRVNGIASIMTFTKNAQNMADLSSCIAAIALLAAAVLTGMLNAFLDVRK